MPTKPEGWFSRRHEDSTAHMERSKEYLENRGKAGRQKRAKEREEARAGRSIAAQVSLIVHRPGNNKKELAHLLKKTKELSTLPAKVPDLVKKVAKGE
jgi:hypothetical protein